MAHTSGLSALNPDSVWQKHLLNFEKRKTRKDEDKP
jgi:hypothetical protein